MPAHQGCPPPRVCLRWRGGRPWNGAVRRSRLRQASLIDLNIGCANRVVIDDTSGARSPVHSVARLICFFLELPNTLAKGAGRLRELAGTEDHHDDDEQDDQFLPPETTHERCPFTKGSPTTASRSSFRRASSRIGGTLSSSRRVSAMSERSWRDRTRRSPRSDLRANPLCVATPRNDGQSSGGTAGRYQRRG